MAHIARRFRVVGIYPTLIEQSVDGNITYVESAPTSYKVELLNLSFEGVETKEGVITLQGDFNGLTGEAYSFIRNYLIERKLLTDGGLLDTSPEGQTLETFKDQRWMEVASIRDGLEVKGFPYMGTWFDSDVRSTARINTAAQAAIAASLTGTPFELSWVDAHNNEVQMTAEEVMGMPAAFAVYVNELHMIARGLRERIYGAESIQEVLACRWEGVEQPVDMGGMPNDTSF